MVSQNVKHFKRFEGHKVFSVRSTNINTSLFTGFIIMKSTLSTISIIRTIRLWISELLLSWNMSSHDQICPRDASLSHSFDWLSTLHCETQRWNVHFYFYKTWIRGIRALDTKPRSSPLHMCHTALHNPNWTLNFPPHSYPYNGHINTMRTTWLTHIFVLKFKGFPKIIWVCLYFLLNATFIIHKRHSIYC